MPSVPAHVLYDAKLCEPSIHSEAFALRAGGSPGNGSTLLANPAAMKVTTLGSVGSVYWASISLRTPTPVFESSTCLTAWIEKKTSVNPEGTAATGVGSRSSGPAQRRKRP